MLLFNKKTVLAIVFSVTQSASSFSASYDQPSPINIVTLMDFKPFIWCDGGVAKGIDIEIVGEMFARIGRSYTITCLPWKRAMAYIKSGDADALFSGYKTKDRQRFAIFLSSPTHMSAFSAFVRKGEKFKNHSVEDFYGTRVGIPLGYSVNPEFDAAKNSNKFGIFETTSTESGIRMLLKGRVDSYINGREVVLYQASQMGIGDQIAVLPKPMHESRPAYFMFSKAAKIANKDQLIQSLNQSLAQMWLDGTVKRITDSFTRPAVTVVEPAQ